MIKVQLLQLFRGRREDVLAVKPTDEVRVLMEPVFFQEFVQDHTSGWQPVETVILIIFIPEFVNAHDFSSNGLVLLLDVPLPPFGASACERHDGIL